MVWTRSVGCSEDDVCIKTRLKVSVRKRWPSCDCRRAQASGRSFGEVILMAVGVGK